MYRWNRRATRALRVAACATASIVYLPCTSGATDLWDGGPDGSGNAWLANSNWDPDLLSGTGPAGADIAQFDSAGSASAINIDFSAPLNNTDSEAIAQIALTGGISRTITKLPGTFGGTIQLNGDSGTILSNSSANFSLTLDQGTSSFMNVRLATTGDIAVTNAAASIVVNAVMNDAAGTTQGFSKSGAGTLVLGAANNFTGPVTINDGTVSINGLFNTGTAAPLGKGTSAIQLGSAAHAATLLSTATGTTNRNVNLGAAGGVISNASGSISFSGVISGDGSLTKTGGGVVVLPVGANTYTGGTIIKAGRIDIVADRGLGATPTALQPANVMLDGGTLRFISNLAGGLTLDANRGVTLTASGGTIDWSQSQGSPTIGYPIASPSGSVLTKLGSRTILSNIAQPNFNGDLNINQGRWNVQTNGAAGNGTIRLQAQVGDIAQLGIGGTNAGLNITLNNSIVLNPTASGTNSIEINNSTPTQNVLTLAGNITGSGRLLKGGGVSGTTGTLVLTGNNSYNGDTVINTGVIKISGGNAIPDSSTVNIASNTPLPNGVATALDLQNSSETIGGLNGGGANDGSVLLGSGTLTVVQSAGPSTFAGAITGAGGSFVKDGLFDLALTNPNNSYTGSTTIKTGTLTVSGATQLGDVTNTLILDGGALIAAGAINSPARNVTLNSAGGAINTNGNAATFGDVDGSGDFTKSGGGTLSVNHLRGGNVTLSAGNIAIAPNGQFAGVSHIKNLNLAAGSLLDLSDNHLITTSPAGTWNGSAYTNVSGLIASGRGTTNSWDGTRGIVTTQSDAIASNYTTLAVASAADVMPATATATALWAGQTITGTDTLVMYTYGGDATLDGKINIDDYIRIDFGTGAGLTGWSNGDFNYDGKINIDDYSQFIDFNIGIQGPAFVTAGDGVIAGGGSAGTRAVPEPMASIVLLLPLLSPLRRARRMEGRR